MEDIKLIIQERFIQRLQKDSASILSIVANPIEEEPAPEDTVKRIYIKDRLPIKKFELIMFNVELQEESEEETDKDIDKFTKYLTKFTNAFYFPTQSTYAFEMSRIRLPYLLLDFSHGSLLKHYAKFENLTSNYKEFDEYKQKIQNKLLKYPFSYGLLRWVTIDEPYDAIILFQTEEKKEAFIQEWEQKIRKPKIDAFYSDILEYYAKGIDTRNIRFQKNYQFLKDELYTALHRTSSSLKNQSEKGQSFLSSRKAQLTSSYSSLTIKVNNTEPEGETQKPFLKKPQKEGLSDMSVTPISPFLQNNFLDKLDKLAINIYKRNNIPPIKQIPYEEYLRKHKESSVDSFKNKRSMEKLKLNPKISVLMVVDDIDEIWLNKSVRSIKDQTYKNWELLIVDNCSPRTYLKSYLSSLNDSRIKTSFYNTKKSYAEALYSVYAKCTGDFITFLQEGDELDTGALFYFQQQINENPETEVIYSNKDQINEQGKRVHPFFKPEWDDVLVTSYPYIEQIVCIKKELIDNHSLFPTQITREPVWEMLLLLRNKLQHVEHNQQVLYHERLLPMRKKDNFHYADALGSYLKLEEIPASIHETDYKGGFYYINQFVEYPKVTIITVDENIHIIEKFLQSFQPDYPNYVIHAGYTGNLKEEDYTNVQYFKFDGYYYAQMANDMVKEAQSEYLLFLDPNIISYDPNFIQKMLTYANEQTIVGSKILDKENTVVNSFFVKNLKHPVSQIFEGQQYHKQFDISVVRSVSAISKSCMLINTETFRSLKFPETYLMHYEDIDLCFTAREKHIAIVFHPQTNIVTGKFFEREEFNDKDTVSFIRKWKNTLKVPDEAVDVKHFLMVKP